MTLAELRYLVAVADLSHFGRAAERCRVTQPTLSSQLRKLEEGLGVPLVERTTRFVTLTPVGTAVVAHARRILEEADQIAELVRHRHGTLMSVLRLGIIPTLSPYILPLLLNRLHKRFPGLRMVLREDLTANLVAALDTYALDVLLIALPEQTAGYRGMPLFLEPFCFACPSGHKLSNRPVVTERELKHERLLLLDEGHCLRDQALEVCGDHISDNRGASDDFRATSLETICEMVAAGLGCTLLPAMAVPHLTARHKHIEVRPLVAAKAHRRIGLLWRASFPRGEDLEEFGRFITGQLPDCVEPIASVPTRTGATTS
ncbi:MAG TPA: LysR substrate-binding domain-containing protein [Acetobacteraceae bacterium]|jgi:LysR family hydrogen peroxide-inducible transcriptional activator|nr:LysR substrate-binding domain-containing protein [Acetobacteraceae bacterium]